MQAVIGQRSRKGDPNKVSQPRGAHKTAASAGGLGDNVAAMLIPLIVACALFMENLDSTVLATSLPAIAAFRRQPDPPKLALTTYLFGLAVFIPISGWVADRFGARTIFRAAIVVFIAGSILCGLRARCWQLVLPASCRAWAGR